MSLNESIVENAAIEWFGDLSYGTTIVADGVTRRNCGGAYTSPVTTARTWYKKWFRRRPVRINNLEGQQHASRSPVGEGTNTHHPEEIP